MYDLRLKTPFTYLVAGPSKSGKTTHIFNILRCRDDLLNTNNNPASVNIIYYYNHWQDIFSEIQSENIVTDWVQQLPTIQDIRDRTEHFRDIGGSIIIIDDFAQHVNQDIADLFTVLSHANNISVFLMTQNIFQRNPVFRTISLNSSYISIHKNPRDSSQIVHFAKQFAPGNSKYIVEAYKACTKKPYSYMLFDHNQDTPDIIRVRSDILPNEQPMKVWIANTCI